MARLTIVRHGEAAAGWGEDPDPGLSPTGHQQAEALADRLAPSGPLPVIVSPLNRTRETAAPLLRRWEIEPIIDPRVGEIVSPTPFAERGAWLAEVMAGRWSEQDEGVARWRRQVVEALLEQDDDAVVVSHFIAINAALGAATDDDRVVSVRVGHCDRVVLDNAGGRLAVVHAPIGVDHTDVL